MTVENFINEFKSVDDKDEYIEKHIVEKYVSYNKKNVICDSIVKTGIYKEINGINLFNINTPMIYMMYKLKLIENYTDIEIDGNNLLNDYDALEMNNLIDNIINHIPKKEYHIWEELLEMCINDEFSKRDIVTFLETKVDALKISMDTIVESIGLLMNQGQE